MYDASQSDIKYDTQYDYSHPGATITRVPAAAVDEDGLLGPSLCRRTVPSTPFGTSAASESDEEDDFRGYFDFGEAWAGRSHISGSSYSTASGSASLRIPSPNRWSPRADQEYDDIMYKLDLGAESPYLRTAYGESVSRVPEMIIEEEEGEGEEGEESVARNYTDVDCRMCLKKAVSRVRTRCCHTVFCRAHLDEWLEREESKGLCPMCDKPCVLGRAAPLPLLSVSTCRSRMSSSSSTSTISTTSTLVEESWWESEAEDTWDVKGGSVDVKELIRDWVGDRKESTRRVASVIGMVLVLFVLLR